ncbi:Transcription factor SPT8 [Cercospora zeina]
MASFDDDNDPNTGSQDDDENEDEEMEDVNEADHDADQDMDQGGDDDEDDGGDDDEDNDDDNDGEDDDEQNENDSPAGKKLNGQRSADGDSQHNPEVVVKSPSPRGSAGRSPKPHKSSAHVPAIRPEALTAQAYDIVPTMAAPHGTSINAVCATPNMKYVFTGGTDGYIRKYDWVDTANGKVPLTVAQKHPFVDSVMKAGSMLTYWENEERSLQTPPRAGNADEGKWTSPVYSLAVEKQAVWLLSGLESGGINLQTTRHSTGNIITTLKEHTSAVSVLTFSDDEHRVLSGSWDKNIHEWDLHSGKVIRSFKGASSQISAIELRPFSSLPVPEVSESLPDLGLGTFSSNNANRPSLNGLSGGPSRRPSGLNGDEDAAGSPDGSLFGDGDHGSLFGDDTGGGGGGGANAFGDDDDDLTRALENEMQTDQDANGDGDTQMQEAENGDPTQTTDKADQAEPAPETSAEPTSNAAPAPADGTSGAESQQTEGERLGALVTNGLPHSDEPLTASATNDESDSKSDLPPQSESVFLDASFDGTLRIWDRRMASPIATIPTDPATPPWCTGACWSPDGNFFYAGRRNCTVDEYSIHHLSTKRSKPNRTFRFQQGSGPVYAVRAMPNKKHLVCASQDILRIYDLQQPESTKHSRVPFTIVPGHRGGVISAIHIDPSCRFMLSAAGNRGWEGSGTEVLLGYEIGIQDEKGIWHLVRGPSA